MLRKPSIDGSLEAWIKSTGAVMPLYSSFSRSKSLYMVRRAIYREQDFVHGCQRFKSLFVITKGELWIVSNWKLEVKVKMMMICRCENMNCWKPGKNGCSLINSPYFQSVAELGYYYVFWHLCGGLVPIFKNTKSVPRRKKWCYFLWWVMSFMFT